MCFCALVLFCIRECSVYVCVMVVFLYLGLLCVLICGILNYLITFTCMGALFAIYVESKFVYNLGTVVFAPYFNFRMASLRRALVQASL